MRGLRHSATIGPEQVRRAALKARAARLLSAPSTSAASILAFILIAALRRCVGPALARRFVVASRPLPDFGGSVGALFAAERASRLGGLPDLLLRVHVARALLNPSQSFVARDFDTGRNDIAGRGFAGCAAAFSLSFCGSIAGFIRCVACALEVRGALF